MVQQEQELAKEQEANLAKEAACSQERNKKEEKEAARMEKDMRREEREKKRLEMERERMEKKKQKEAMPRSGSICREGNTFFISGDWHRCISDLCLNSHISPTPALHPPLLATHCPCCDQGIDQV